MYSHYVPRLILKKFAPDGKICLFNVQTGELLHNVKIEKAYAKEDYYDEETEKKLNLKVESQFGNFLSNKLLKYESTVELSRDDLFLIKKFLLISVIRSEGCEQFVKAEKYFYDNLKKHYRELAQARGASEEEIKTGEESLKAPFEEKQIEGETDFAYWMRTLNVILDTNGAPEKILEHPDKTYPAFRWAKIINEGYLAFWDAHIESDEFVVTDVGMTSENEKGWNGVTVHNVKKTGFLLNLIQKEKDKGMQQYLLKLHHDCCDITENFMMFPISARRMIVLISPFFKFRKIYGWLYKMPALEYLTNLPDENLFASNKVRYVLPQPSDGIHINPHEGDRYIYDVKNLTAKQTQYCNALFMDRINTFLGFGSLEKIAGGLATYSRYTPRVNYTNLYKAVTDYFRGN